MVQLFNEVAKTVNPLMAYRFCLEIFMVVSEMLRPILKEAEEKYVPSLRVFRDYVDGMVVHKAWCKRDEILVKLIYVLGARVSEVVGKVTPWMESHNKSHAYGTLLRTEICPYNHRVELDGKTVIQRESLLLIHSAIAKMKLHQEKQPDTSPQDPQAPPILRCKMKTVAIPCNPDFEPWCFDLMHWINPTEHKNPDHIKPSLCFMMVEDNVQRIVKSCLAGLRDIDPRVTEIHPHILRHWRVRHLTLNYRLTSIEKCAYIGWSIRSQEANRGQVVSANLDTYSHLGYLDYIEKLLVPLQDVM